MDRWIILEHNPLKMLKPVSLEFGCAKNVWRFLVEVNASNVQVRKNVVTSCFSQPVIDLACRKYKAVIISTAKTKSPLDRITRNLTRT